MEGFNMRYYIVYNNDKVIKINYNFNKKSYEDCIGKKL